MALTPAEKQQRYRDRLKAQAQSKPDVIQHELQKEIERVERGELSEAERIALAHRLADLAMQHQWRASALAKLAMKVRSNDRDIGSAWWRDEIVPKIVQPKG
jgi:hypothetical protein